LLGEIRIDESGMLGFEIGSRVEHHLNGFFAIAADSCYYRIHPRLDLLFS